MQQLWSWRKALLVLACTCVTLAALPTAHARPPFAHGAVVALQGTPHLWIADEQGTLHWGGDTRALAGKHVNWGDRTEVSLDRLRTLPVGDPWLSAGLLKDGDPIYLVKWEHDWAQPQLLHIQSISEVGLFGINGNNYGNFVLDKAAWEARYGVPVVLATGGDVIALTPPNEVDGWTYFQYETSLTRTASYPSSLGVGTPLLSGDVPVGDLIGTQRKYIVVIDHFLLYIQHLNFGIGTAYPFGNRGSDGTIDFEVPGDGIDFSQPRLRLAAAGIAVFQSSPRTDTGLIITPTFRPTRHLPPSHCKMTSVIVSSSQGRWSLAFPTWPSAGSSALDPQFPPQFYRTHRPARAASCVQCSLAGIGR